MTTIESLRVQVAEVEEIFGGSPDLKIQATAEPSTARKGWVAIETEGDVNGLL